MSQLSKSMSKANITTTPDDVRTYGCKVESVAALIYTHLRKEFGLPVDR
jgi:hypothetical protein